MLGSGTQTSPYLVSTPQDLDAIRNNITAYYEFTNDIDMTDFGNWIPITKVSPYFSGHIDGKGYKIINLSIVDNSQYTGFIGYSNGGSIGNLGLENVYVESNNNHVAGLIGMNYLTTISNCYVTGTIKETDSTKFYIGGLVGRHYGLIENCYTQCNINGGKYMGGFVGIFADQQSIVKNNYSKSIVTGTDNCGIFYGNTNTNVGYKPTFQYNFFDSEYGGTINFQTTGVIAKTTTEMKTQSTFTGWDFTTVWDINNNYPTLKVFNHTAPPKNETITVSSYANPVQSELNKYGKVFKVTESILSPIFTTINRKTRTERSVSTYLSPITSNVQKSNRTVKNSTQNVHTFIRPIGSSIYRESKKVNELLAYIKPIQARPDVLIPLNTITPNAYVSTLENNSKAFEMENMSTVSYILNPSYVEVME